MKNTKPLTVDRPTLARVLGVSVRSIDRLETSGILVPVGKPRRGTPSRYDLVIAVPAFIESKLAPLDARERYHRSRPS